MLYNLLTAQEPVVRPFCNDIYNCNSALAMTSIGRKLDYSVNNNGGPWLYSTGQAKATNFIASKIDFLGAIGCQDHSYGG